MFLDGSARRAARMRKGPRMWFAPKGALTAALAFQGGRLVAWRLLGVESHGRSLSDTEEWTQVADGELLRLVEGIHRERNIDREVLFESLESALLTAARKRFGVTGELRVSIDRETGEISAFDGDEPISPTRLGRIAAQTAKQVIMQKIREAESEVVLEEYEQRLNTVVPGTVSRVEGGTIIVNLGHAEGILPYGEQMPTERYRMGDRLRALVVDVRRSGSRVKIILSRTHPQFVRELFRLEVPEVNDGTIEIKALAREAGYRTKVAVASNDPKVDATGACVGVRGSRIRSIVDELSGEKIDVIRWSDSADVLLRSCLRPAEVSRLVLDNSLALALAVVPQDQLSLAIGRRGQNVRLASRLTGWDIEIVTPEEAEQTEAAILTELESIEGIGEDAARALLGAGCLSARSVMLLSDEDLNLILALGPEGVQALRQWIEAELPQGADHLSAYQEVLAQREAEEAALAEAAEEEPEQVEGPQEPPAEAETAVAADLSAGDINNEVASPAEGSVQDTEPEPSGQVEAGGDGPVSQDQEAPQAAQAGEPTGAPEEGDEPADPENVENPDVEHIDPQRG